MPEESISSTDERSTIDVRAAINSNMIYGILMYKESFNKNQSNLLLVCNGRPWAGSSYTVV